MFGRFGLSADHPDGCSQCFCSGVTSDCEEAGGLYRSAVSAHTHSVLPVVSQSNLQGVVSGVYLQGGDVLLDTRRLNSSRLAGALYWRLPAHFHGPQVCVHRTCPHTCVLSVCTVCPPVFNVLCCVFFVAVVVRRLALLHCPVSRRGWLRAVQSGASGPDEGRDHEEAGHLQQHGRPPQWSQDAAPHQDDRGTASNDGKHQNS